MADLTEQQRDVEALATVLIEHRDRDYAASVYKFTPDKMARAILTSDWLAARDAAQRRAGRAQVGKAVMDWSAKNEIAEPPLDWAWLGEILRWAAPDLHEETEDGEASR